MRGLVHFLMVALILLPGSVRALTVSPHTVDRAAWQASSQTLSARITYRAIGSPIPGTQLYVKRSIAIGAETLGRIIKKRMFSPWGAAMTALAVGAGYIGEAGEVSQDYTKIGTVPEPGTYQTWYIDGGGPHGPMAWDDICEYWAVTWSGASSPSFSEVKCTGMTVVDPQWPTGRVHLSYYHEIYEYYTSYGFWINPAGTVENTCPYGWVIQDDSCVPESVEVLTDEEVGLALAPLVDDWFWPTILTDPDTALPDEEITELADPIQDIADDIEAEYDNDPTTEPTTDPATNDTGLESQTEEPQEDYSFEARQENYNTDLETPEKQDLVTVLDGVKAPIQAFGDSVGVTATAGSCTISIPFSLFGFSSSSTIDFCQFSGIFSAIGSILLGLSYLVAGVIVLRV